MKFVIILLVNMSYLECFQALKEQKNLLFDHDSEIVNKT